MKKGFDFWISVKASSFLKKYWVIFGAFYLLAMALAIIANNPFVFLIVGFLPCPIILIYRFTHDPFYNLEGSIAKYDPEFYKLLLDLSSKSKPFIIATSKRKNEYKYRNGMIYGALMKWHADNKWRASNKWHNKVDQRIVTFTRNNIRINNSSGISLSVWLLTFMILSFVLFFRSQ